MRLFFFGFILLCSNHDFSTGLPSDYWHKRSDDLSVADLGAVVQHQAAVIQKQSADIQALQAKVMALENAGASRDGQIHSLRQKVAFTAQFNDGGPIDVGQSAPIAFNHVVLNEGHGYDANSGIFIAPVSGIYLFLLHLKSDANENGGGDAHVEIVQSGTRLALTSVGGSAGEYRHSSVSAVTHVEAGEKVFARHAYGSTIIDKWQETSFTGVLLFAD